MAREPELSLTALHARLVEALRQNKPHVIHSWMIADNVDLDDRGAHLDQLLSEVCVYVRAAVQDIKSKSNILTADVFDCVDALDDCKGDLVGQFLNLADDLRNGMGRAA